MLTEVIRLITAGQRIFTKPPSTTNFCHSLLLLSSNFYPVCTLEHSQLRIIIIYNTPAATGLRTAKLRVQRCIAPRGYNKYATLAPV